MIKKTIKDLVFGFRYLLRSMFTLCFACAPFVALTLFCGCSGSNLSGPVDSTVSLLRAADSGFIKKDFVDAKFTPAFESREPEKIRALFDRSLTRCEHWKNFIELACSLNDVRLITGAVRTAVRQPGDAVTVSEVSFDYKLYGFAGLEYDVFVKEGKMSFIVSAADDGVLGTRYRIISDGFADHFHLYGRVIDEKNRPVCGAAVTVETEKRSYACTSGHDGAFSIEFVDSPSVVVKVDKTGFKPFEKNADGMKKGEYFSVGDLVVTALSVVSASETGEAKEDGARCALTPGAETRSNRLAATALDRKVKLSWPDLKAKGGGSYSYWVYRRGPSEEKYKLLFSLRDSTNYTDEGLVNGGVYLYRVEAFAAGENGQTVVPAAVESSAGTYFGPVASIPASLRLAFEFEDGFARSPKWVGVKPRILTAKQFSGGGFVVFDPVKTQAFSFLSPRKIKTGYYRAFLYAQRSDSNSLLKIEIKQFGEPEEARAFYRGGVSLKSNAAQTGRGVIDLGEMLMEPKNWKNEPLNEDYCEISIKVSLPEEDENDSEDSPATGGNEKKVALDVIEFVKID